MAPKTSYKIEASANFGNISISDDSKLNKITKSTSNRMYGDVGNSPTGTVKIQTKFGDISIQ